MFSFPWGLFFRSTYQIFFVFTFHYTPTPISLDGKYIKDESTIQLTYNKIHPKEKEYMK